MSKVELDGRPASVPL